MIKVLLLITGGAIGTVFRYGVSIVDTAFDATLLPFRDTFGQCDRLFPHRLLLEYSRNL